MTILANLWKGMFYYSNSCKF